MPHPTLRPVLDGGTFFESPRWRGDRWYVTDVYRHAVVSMALDGGAARDEVVLPQKPSGIDFLPDGTLLVIAAEDHQLLRVGPDGSVEVHASFGHLARGMASDLVVDAAGHAFVAHVGFSLEEFDLTSGEPPPAAVVVRVDPDGRAEVAAAELLLPNGMLVTTDGGTLLVGESLGARYTAFALGADGSLGDRRVWADLATPTTRPAPDGCALDAAGCVWFADAFGGRCLRVAEGGEVLDEVAAPDGLNVYACMLGGPDGRTLLLCCAPDFFPEVRATATDAVLVSTLVDVPHAGRP